MPPLSRQPLCLPIHATSLNHTIIACSTPHPIRSFRSHRAYSAHRHDQVIAHGAKNRGPEKDHGMGSGLGNSF
jgi:hypothetical protein